MAILIPRTEVVCEMEPILMLYLIIEGLALEGH